MIWIKHNFLSNLKHIKLILVSLGEKKITYFFMQKYQVVQIWQTYDLKLLPA